MSTIFRFSFINLKYVPYNPPNPIDKLLNDSNFNSSYLKPNNLSATTPNIIFSVHFTSWSYKVLYVFIVEVPSDKGKNVITYYTPQTMHCTFVGEILDIC